MDKRNDKPKIAIIGPYPPPYGGISVHIKRMHRSLLKKNLEHVIYVDTETKEENIVRVANRKKWLLKYFFSTKENITHFHSIGWRERILVGIMGFLGKKVILTIHGGSLNDQINQGNWVKKRMLTWALKNMSNIIVVNPKIKDLIISLGIKSGNVKVIPSFIPPTVRKGEIAEIPQRVWNFIDTHKPIISANASAIRFYFNQDLYGIDMCINLCAKLRNAYPKIGFVFCLPNIGDYGYFKKMKQRIVEKGAENNFLFQTKPCQFYPILMKSDIFVRPTNSDGYGVSVAEAIYFRVPAVASDVCARPEGTILFKNRDTRDFTLRVEDVLDSSSLCYPQRIYIESHLYLGQTPNQRKALFFCFLVSQVLHTHRIGHQQSNI